MKKIIFIAICIIANNYPLNLNSLPWDNECKDGDELNIVKQFLPNNPIILEAGACGGEDTVKFKKFWPECTVYAFEPVIEFYNRLKNNIEHLENVYIFNHGLFTKTGLYEFNLCQGQTPGGASSLFPSNKLPEAQYDEREIQIYCKNLDEWADENNVSCIDYMWLDMEGSEYYVLNSSPKILKTVKVISCELNFREFRKGMTQFNDIYNFLINNGFYLYKLWGSPTWQAVGIFIKS